MLIYFVYIVFFYLFNILHLKFYLLNICYKFINLNYYLNCFFVKTNLVFCYFLIKMYSKIHNFINSLNFDYFENYKNDLFIFFIVNKVNFN